jgi:TetR/AcrR family transcriptional regulator, mexJK operon transcriptional repressor
MIITETPRFPQLGTLFFSTVTQRGLALITDLLRSAREQQLIAEVDLAVVTHMLLGGLVASVIMNLVLAEEPAQPQVLNRADAVVEVIMRALRP